MTVDTTRKQPTPAPETPHARAQRQLDNLIDDWQHDFSVDDFLVALLLMKAAMERALGERLGVQSQ